MPLIPGDRALLDRCLAHQPGSWNDFVDRFLGLIYHVIRTTSHLRGTALGAEEIEDIAAEVLQRITTNDYALLRHFRRHSSLETYMAVVARRICLNELVRRAPAVPSPAGDAREEPRRRSRQQAEGAEHQLGLEKIEEVQRLLRKLPARERQVVRLHYLEGRSYEEISTALGIPVRGISPILARARSLLNVAAASKNNKGRDALKGGRG